MEVSREKGKGKWDRCNARGRVNGSAKGKGKCANKSAKGKGERGNGSTKYQG